MVIPTTSNPDHKVDLMLDSGAYSAWQKRETLDVYEYIKYIEKHRDYVKYIVNLDVIPGVRGKPNSIKDVEESARRGYENYLIMKKAGINVMPVYHMGEHIDWLKRMLDDGADYIGISPANDRTTKQKRVWLTETFGYLCGSKGYPEVKTHGFGVTSVPLISEFPYYSVDSVSWILFGAYGQILIPYPNKITGEPDFTQSPFVLYVSEYNKDGKNDRKPANVALGIESNFDALGERDRAYVLKYLEGQGFNLLELRNEHFGRLRINCRFYRLLEKSLANPKPFIAGDSFFGAKSDRGSSTNVLGPMHMIFTSSGEEDTAVLMNEEGIRDRLISYYHIRDGHVLDLDHFVKTGLVKRPMSKRELKKLIKNRPKLEEPVTLVGRPKLEEPVTRPKLEEPVS